MAGDEVGVATEYRDWRPGDGLRCTYAKRAPRELPCGPPVKTALSHQDVGAVGRKAVVHRPLCANHSATGITPGAIVAEARQIAVERLCARYWDEYQTYLTEAVEQLNTRT